MHLSLLTSLFTLATLTTSSTPAPPSLSAPTPPALEWLYTAYCECDNALYADQGPLGIRKAIPIVGGNFSGPRLRGEILNLGADWGLQDPSTGIFTADTRYNLRTHDGANLWLRTSGPRALDGGLHLRVRIETGSGRYWWLNNVVAVGVLHNVATTATGFTLRIDVWHMAGEFTNTTFVNGTTYA